MVDRHARAVVGGASGAGWARHQKVQELAQGAEIRDEGLGAARDLVPDLRRRSEVGRERADQAGHGVPRCATAGHGVRRTGSSCLRTMTSKDLKRAFSTVSCAQSAHTRHAGARRKNVAPRHAT